MASDDNLPHARIRVWAAARGIYVEPRGPLPDAVVAAWRADHDRVARHEAVVRAWAVTRGLPLDATEPIPTDVLRRDHEQQRLGGRAVGGGGRVPTRRGQDSSRRLKLCRLVGTRKLGSLGCHASTCTNIEIAYNDI